MYITYNVSKNTFCFGSIRNSWKVVLGYGLVTYYVCRGVCAYVCMYCEICKKFNLKHLGVILLFCDFDTHQPVIEVNDHNNSFNDKMESQ